MHTRTPAHNTQVMLDIRVHSGKPSLRLPSIIVSRVSAEEMNSLEASIRYGAWGGCAGRALHG
jgi:hypothetical protein